MDDKQKKIVLNFVGLFWNGTSNKYFASFTPENLCVFFDFHSCLCASTDIECQSEIYVHVFVSFLKYCVYGMKSYWNVRFKCSK